MEQVVKSRPGAWFAINVANPIDRRQPPTADHHARPARRQLERRGPAQPAAAARHDRHLSVEQAGREDPRGHPERQPTARPLARRPREPRSDPVS